MIHKNNSNYIEIDRNVGNVSGTVEESVQHTSVKGHFENPQAKSSSNVWVDVCFGLMFICLAVAIFVPSVSETTKVLSLGGDLVIAGFWGRRKFRQN